MAIHIRRADTADAEALHSLNGAFNGKGAATIEQLALSLAENRQETVLIALADGQTAGFICGRLVRSMCYGAPHGEICELYVSEPFRRRGAGRRLMHAMEKIFIEGGACAVKLGTNVLNTAAQRFYESCGYAGKFEMQYRKSIGGKA